MVTEIIWHYNLDDDDVKAYRFWLKTPLAEKIDAVVDASAYAYDFILVYNAEEECYRRVEDEIDIRCDEVPLYKSTPYGPLETETEVLALIDDTIEQVKYELSFK